MADVAVNNEIQFPEVLVISNEGQQLGKMTPAEGIQLAKELKMDLVCLSPNAPIPVCKILNYGKYKFEQSKREKNAKKNQKTIEISEVQFSMTTQTHDLETKANTVKRLIESKGNMVRVVLRLRGRELSFTDMAIEKIQTFVEMCSDFASVYKEAKLEGRDVRVILEKKKENKS